MEVVNFFKSPQKNFSRILRASFIVAVFFCAGGAAPEDYNNAGTTSLTNTFKWRDEIGDTENNSGDWTDETNWLQLGVDGTYYTAARYPNGSDNSVYFTGNVEVTVTVNKDISLDTLYVHSEGNKNIKFKIETDFEIICNDFSLVFLIGGHNTIIDGGGTLNCGKISRTKTSIDESSPYYITINAGSTLLLNEFSGIRENDGNFKVYFTGNGTLSIPGSGENLNGVGELSDDMYKTATTLTIVANSSPSYYTYTFSDDKITLTRGVSTGNTIYYNYKVTEYSGDSGTFAIDGEYFALNDEYYQLAVEPSGTKEKTYSIETDSSLYQSGNYFTIEIYTPDKRLKLGEITYPEAEVEDFYTYYWTGAGTDTSWTNSENWAYKDKDRDLYVSVAEYDGGNYNDHYPGYDNKEHKYGGETILGDVAVFTNRDAISNTSGFTVNSEGYTVHIITNEDVDKGLFLRATNTNKANIVTKGYVVTYFSEIQSATVAGGILQVNNPLTVTGDLTNDSYIWCVGALTISGTFTNTGTVDCGSAAFTANGTFTNTGFVKTTAGTISLNRACSGENGSIVLNGTGPLIFGENASGTISSLNINSTGSVTNNSSKSITFENAAGHLSDDITFTGNFSFGSFSASGGGNYFIDGSVDFSNCQTFSNNLNGTIYFYRTTADKTANSSVSRTFTTKTDMALYKFFFGGEVKIVLNGAVTVASNCKMNTASDDYKQTETFTATLTGSGTLTLNGTATSLEIYRMSDTGGVYGNLVFDADVSTEITDAYGYIVTHSGTKLTINKGKTVTVNADYRGDGNSDDPKNELEVNGTLSVTGDLGIGQNNKAYLTVGETGTVTVSGTLTNTTKITNAGTVTAVTAINATEIENSETGKILTNSGTITAEKITVTSSTTDESNPLGILLNAGRLEVTGSEESSISELYVSGGTVTHSGSGNLTVTYLEVKKGTTALTHTFSNSGSGKFYFSKFSATALGGDTLSFSGEFYSTDDGEIYLSGKDSDSLLSITGSSGIIYLESPQTAIYLSVSKNVTVSGTAQSGWDGTQPENSISAYNSEIAESGVTRIYGWIFANDLFWSGSTDSDWSKKNNWLSYGLVKTGFGRNATYSYQYSQSTKLPATSTIVHIATTCPQSGTDGSSTQTVTTFPELTESVEIMGLDLEEDASLTLNGSDFTVSDYYSNTGTIRLSGTETISLPENSVDEGTWAYFGSSDGTGILQPVTNLTFNEVVVEGNGIIKSLDTSSFGPGGKLTLNPASSDSTGSTGINLTAGNTTGETVLIAVPVTLSTQAKITVNGSTIDFTEAITDSETDASSSANLLTFECTTTDGEADIIQLDEEISAHLCFTGNANFSADSVKQTSDYNFMAGDGTNGGNVTFGTNGIELGNLIVSAGSSFTQTGINTLTHSVSSIENNGTVIWDSGSEGGTLTLNGSVTGTNAAETVFNKKNVSLGDDAEVSGVFYNLSVPEGKTLTNGNGITVRNNFTVDGSYTHNSQTLNLGETTISNGTTFESGTDGIISGSGSGINLGNVTITQKDTPKTIDFDSEVTFGSLTFENDSEGNSPTGGISLCGKIILNSDVTFVSEIFILKDTEISASSKTLTFKKSVSQSSSAVSDCSLKIDANIDAVAASATSSITFDAGYILSSGTADSEWKASTGSLKILCDFYSAQTESTTLTLVSSVSLQKSLFVVSGTLSTSSAVSVTEDLVVFGTNYSADDPRFDGTDTRFAYFGSDSLSYNSDLALHSGKLAASASFSVGENLYVNGADLSGCYFVIPDNSASKPVFNPTNAVTEKQWGSPYAVVFNSQISDCTVSAATTTSSAFVAASKTQGCTDGNGNTGFQFNAPKISEAFSVSDSVLCIKFDMALENSNNEAGTAVALTSDLSSGGIFYNGGNVAFDGIFYTESDGTTCSVRLSDSTLNNTDIPANTPLYLKVNTAENKWNTDATAASEGNSDSTDRSGTHRTCTTDLSLFEGLFYSAEGKTMSRNYGTGLWKDEDTAGDYSTSEVFATVDKARPVLIDVFTGQELHTKNTGTADTQKPYDSHNFIEFRYSEPVNIGDLAGGADTNNQNIQAQTDFDSESSHGGAITNISSGGLLISGFAQIEGGEVTAGVQESGTHKTDTALPHSLYRKFARNASEAESVQDCRARISVAGYVDENNPVSYGGSTFNNWTGYIDSSETPYGLVTPLTNSFITDLAVDSEGNALKNTLDESNDSRTVRINEASQSLSQTDPSSALNTATTLYGDWDTLPPVFTPYIDSTNYFWTDGDSDTRCYEIVGTVDSNTSAYLDRVEFHLFDNKQNYSSSDTYKWVSQIGWTSGSASLSSHSAPESSGGSRPFTDDSRMTLGGIRRSSLANASKAFTYNYTVDGSTSSDREFETSEISQNAKSSLFRNENLTTTTTENDGLYLALDLNSEDSTLPIRAGFVLTYTPEKSFITDLAGNRLIQTDSGKSTKTIRSVDITPPSFSVVLSPIGENKIYAVFTKPLAYNGEYLSELSNLDEILEKIRGSLEFVYSENDDIDSAAELTGDSAIEIEKVELSSYSADYTSLLFTLNRKITLDDIEKIWLRINDQGDTIHTFSGETTASYFQDSIGNAIPFHTCHAISDFAVNAVNVLYAYSKSDDEENWNEEGVYGQGLAPLSSDYAVHDFSADGGNYSKLRSAHDIAFQMQFIGGQDDSGVFPPQNNEGLELVIDKKANLSSDWISSKFNLLTKNDWRIWLDSQMNSLSNSFNPSPETAGDIFEDVEDSELLKNMTLSNENFNFANKDEYQFFFKILDSNGNTIKLNHDGDKTTAEIPLYAFRMPEEKISAGDFSFLDLWSFRISGITKQRGGVSILNNVINAGIGEKCTVEVEMESSGNLNVYVMTLDGNIVKRLSKGTVTAGTHYFYWDGKNNGGKTVARGLYFVRVSGNGIDETRKVMVVK